MLALARVVTDKLPAIWAANMCLWRYHCASFIFRKPCGSDLWQNHQQNERQQRRYDRREQKPSKTAAPTTRSSDSNDDGKYNPE